VLGEHFASRVMLQTQLPIEHEDFSGVVGVMRTDCHTNRQVDLGHETAWITAQNSNFCAFKPRERLGGRIDSMSSENAEIRGPGVSHRACSGKHE